MCSGSEGDMPLNSARPRFTDNGCDTVSVERFNMDTEDRGYLLQGIQVSAFLSLSLCVLLIL